LPDSEEFVSCTGITVANVDGKTINMGIVDTLAPKEVAEWHVIVKALKNDDARFNVALSSDQFGNPIHKEESTHLY
jgi:predicted component of type VI protein secretion system